LMIRNLKHRVVPRHRIVTALAPMAMVKRDTVALRKVMLAPGRNGNPDADDQVSVVTTDLENEIENLHHLATVERGRWIWPSRGEKGIENETEKSIAIETEMEAEKTPEIGLGKVRTEIAKVPEIEPEIEKGRGVARKAEAAKGRTQGSGADNAMKEKIRGVDAVGIGMEKGRTLDQGGRSREKVPKEGIVETEIETGSLGVTESDTVYAILHPELEV